MMRLGKLQSLACHMSRAMTASGVTRNIAAACVQYTRCNSTIPDPYKFLNVKEDATNGVSILELKKKPVNSLSLEFLTEINIAFEKFENDKTVRGVIISSALPVYSAGLDIMEMHQPEPERLRAFWQNVQDMSLHIFNSSKVVISAIDGACIAGGCIFAWGADYRIMSEGKHPIGLNETKLGIAAPFWLANMAVDAMGLRNAEKMLQLGETYPAAEALRLGMIDETCTQGKAADVAKERMTEWLKIADSGRVITKQRLRANWVKKFQKGREEDLNDFCSFVNLSTTQRLLKSYVAALKAKSG